MKGINCNGKKLEVKPIRLRHLLAVCTFKHDWTTLTPVLGIGEVNTSEC